LENLHAPLHLPNGTDSVKSAHEREALQSLDWCSSIRVHRSPVTYPAFSQLCDARFGAALATDGYRPFAALHYGRIVGDVFQFFLAHCSQGPQAALSIEMGSLLLCEPHNFLSLDLGGSFPDETLAKTYVAPDEGQWHQAVDLAVVDYLTIARARMDRRSRLSGLMDHGFALLGRSGSPHLWFTLAVGHVRLDDETRARALAQEALVRYRKSTELEPNASWAIKGAQRAELLVKELYAVRAGRLLDGWKAGTLSSLGLDVLPAS
jgi:hypothetical protein